MRRVYLIFIIAGAVWCVMSSMMWHEATRLKANMEALCDTIRLYRTALGHSAASARELRLTVRELRRERDEAVREIGALNIKLRRVTQYSRSVALTHLCTTLPLEPQRDRSCDSMAPAVTARVATWEDGHIAVRGTVREDSLTVEVRSIDTLRQVVHRIPRRFLGIPFGTKYLRQEITSSNPHTQLVYSEYIKVERR
ncbi:MAG: hypothetical protein J6Q07_00295 [Alistipes sp.]|nr:hypothetical protein [Alistipes sp.]